MGGGAGPAAPREYWGLRKMLPFKPVHIFRQPLQRQKGSAFRAFPGNLLLGTKLKLLDLTHGAFMKRMQKVDPSEERMDPRDRLIVALYSQLKAERETRETLEWVIRNGGLSSEVLSAIASDPVPVITSEDTAAIEKLVALDIRRRKH
jgi:U3 small nucleolar ribonucleoprotein component